VSPPDPRSLLSPRVLKVYDLLQAGVPRHEIAGQLGIALRSVNAYWSRAKSAIRYGGPRPGGVHSTHRQTPEAAAAEARLANAERCHCGLTLPCYHRPAWDVAGDRRGT
jgi:hypothetical protein